MDGAAALSRIYPRFLRAWRWKAGVSSGLRRFPFLL